MRLRLIECPAFSADVPTYRPGDCWFARESTSEERAAVERVPTMHQATGGRWAIWATHGRLLDDSEIAMEHRARRPLIVVLPNGAPFVTTSPTSAGSTVREWHRRMAEAEKRDGISFDEAWLRVPRPAFQAGWKIEGDGPTITLHPSINYDPGGSHAWHGWLKGGVLS